MTDLSTCKALARMSPGILGVDPNRVFGMRTTPAFWLLKAEIEKALPWPTFLWKCTSPIETQTHHPSQGP